MEPDPHVPRLALTMGDPAGIGPEVVLKALAQPHLLPPCRGVVFGDLAWMRRTAEMLGLPLRVVPVDEGTCARQAASPPHADGPLLIEVRQATDSCLDAVRHGELSREAGLAAGQAVTAAARAVMAGEMDALVTAPLNKEALAMAGFAHPGHTELLADLTGTSRYGMLLVAGPLRVIHVSTHVSLRTAIERVTAGRVLECLRLGHQACRSLGLDAPRLAVAGLNPHAGEQGMFGREELDEIAPAVARAREEGMDASGPHPPDTVFARAARGEFDVVVAMYHDQGHIPVKLHGFDRGVNITVGLPVLRTSVDHGTAFDIAGQGVAREQSMQAAIGVAVQMVHARRERDAREQR